MNLGTVWGREAHEIYRPRPGPLGPARCVEAICRPRGAFNPIAFCFKELKSAKPNNRVQNYDTTSESNSVLFSKENALSA